jgi:tetratricopeptide (TPR) repeat protein
MSSSGYSQGKYADALSWNDKSMAIVKQVNEEDLTIETLTYRALIFQGMNRAEEALAVFSEIFDKHTQNNQAEESARILVNMAEIYAKQGNLAEAIKKYEASYAIREKIPNFNPSLMGYLCRRLINLYAELKEFQTAFSYAVKAYQFYEQANDQEELDECLTDLFKLAYENKDLEGAIDYSKKLLEIYKKRGDLKSIADKSTNIGILYKEKGDDETSLNYLNEALATLEKIGDKEAIAAICVNLGEVYHALGKDDKSLEVLERSYQIRAEMGVPDRVYHACNNLMILFKEKNNCIKVLEYAELADPYIAKANIEQASLVRHYEMISGCAYEFQQVDKVIAAQKNLVRLYEQGNQKPKLIQSYINLAVYLKENKRYEEALSYFEKVTALAIDLNMKVEIAGSYYEMGEINFFLNNFAAAVDYLKKSVAMRETMPNQNEPLVTLYGYLANLLTQMDNCKEAIGYHEKALALVAREEEKQEIRKLIEECQKKQKNK